MINLIKKFFFSTRLMSFLFIAFAVALAFGTFIESWYSTATARIWIYNTLWFEAIMLFFVINFMGNMFKYRLFRKEKWAVLLLHLSWIFIIVGAFVTRYISFEGMMPIREGATENVFYSDKTYFTALVYGDADGTRMQKEIQEPILVTSEGIMSSFPVANEFKGQDFSISYAGFIDGAKEGLIIGEEGNRFLKIVESGEGGRHDHYLEEGVVQSIHNVLFALNRPTDGAINITATDSVYSISSPFEGTYMRMADMLEGTVQKDTIQKLQLRSLYQMANMQFVMPDSLVQGKNGIIRIPDEERTENMADALIVDVTSNGETVQKKLLGSRGMAVYSDEFNVGGLDFVLSYGSKVYTLPFGIKLNDFIAEKYPGTESGYASFMSRVTVEDEKSFDYDIFMNNILDHKGYRFFQSGFDPDEKGTTLSVNHDFWGTNITYLGYFMLYAGLMGIMFFGKTRFKDLGASLEKVKAKKAKMTALLFLMFLFGIQAQEVADSHLHNDIPTQDQIDSIILASAVSKEHAAAFGKLVIQDDGGRMKPINTFTSELLRKLSLKNGYLGLNPDQVFLSMMSSPILWSNTNIIALDKKGQNDSIRHVIGVPLDRKTAKLIEFFDEEGNYKLSPFLTEATSTNNPNKFQQDYKDANIRLGLLNRALSGEIVKIFPLLDNENNKWISALEYRGGQYPVSDSLYGNFIKNSIPYYMMTLQKAKESGDYTEADKLLAAFKKNQENHGKEVLPSDRKIETEVIYNKLDIFNILYKSYAIFGILLFFVLIFQIFKDRSIWRVAIYFLKGTIFLLFIWHTAGLVLRWYISGHAPWSDAYESIIYVAWATLGMGLLFARKSNLTIAAATFVTAMLLWIAHQNWVDPSISNLVPVLDSYWLMIHVSIIVGSYGPLTVGMILGVTSLILIILTNKKNKARMDINLKELTIINELVLTVGLVMLTIGNFLGGMWANESWGRYWGWDPKETWALVSIMVYAFVIHMRLVPGLRSRWLFNFFSVIAFASIMMTYFGVNFYLVGLHSYASGAQVITPVFIYYTIIGVFVLGAVSYWRYKVNYSK
ncbi:cytochrome c biogenesis protein CcsA [Cellulophaga sp. F20128]|uniref:cytochrome c biogenesis protein CcsA n=1 Tax=Cellulophaga sp. F20128 TaxID=2926413 RepID=UPI001FF47E94|nr:cytochrome c biogenesis protein CcsA [Cellulophaga sp. F20128]MCK0157076.1 cytochrome c biogenesis protein CcsA [Cellulophaga sp. F20128]